MLSPTPDSLSGGYAPSESARPKSATRQRGSGERSNRDRYQHTKTRIGKQRGAKVAQIDIARRLTEAVWHMLTRNQPFAPAGAALRLAA